MGRWVRESGWNGEEVVWVIWVGFSVRAMSRVAERGVRGRQGNLVGWRGVIEGEIKII